MKARTFDKADVYERITAQIIKDVEAGTIPWLIPWSHSKATQARDVTLQDVWPANAITGHLYNGANVFQCWMHQSRLKAEGPPLFLTFKQAKAAGGYVRKGEQSIIVIGFNSGLKKVEQDDGTTKTKKTFYAFGHFVFHISQCENVKLPKRKPIERPVGLDDDKAWQAFIKATGADIRHGGTSAHYKPIADYIQMPTAKAFKTKDDYKAVELHELTHWTSHKTRCDRPIMHVFQSEGYAKEELIAELGSAFLCAKLGVVQKTVRHADYVGDWLKVLKNDKRAIVRAASQAMKATTFIETLVGDALKPKVKRKRLKPSKGKRR